MHFVSQKDSASFFARDYPAFENPQLIMHDFGHRPPKYFGDEDVEKFHSFFKKQYVRKFGDEHNAML